MESQRKKENPFTRCKHGEHYFYINDLDAVKEDCEKNMTTDDRAFAVANYCTDKNLLQQRAWHETLNRLLWRYSMEHDGDKIDWNDTAEWKHIIYYCHERKHFRVDIYSYMQYGSVYFHTKEIAENAIKEIVEPFMAEHPDFVW